MEYNTIHGVNIHIYNIIAVQENVIHYGTMYACIGIAIIYYYYIGPGGDKIASAVNGMGGFKWHQCPGQVQFQPLLVSHQLS